ncbi:MAG TPA: ABC transporter permease subunit [Bacillota bacterium]|jgi:hypothetical protein|nr:ABC transporter permease subunit [Bacillota bacterium]HPZ14955.1 ABC transporter permease subunit [Bacillota bacterium]
MIAGSIVVTLGALVIGVPLGLGSAIYLSEFAPKRSVGILKPMVELLAGIPSVVFGFIGLAVLVPFVRDHLGGPGFSVLSSSLVLGVMVLPTMTSISYDALRAVPKRIGKGCLPLARRRGKRLAWRLCPWRNPGFWLLRSCPWAEPCSALDPIATLKIEELMYVLRDYYTIVIVTHNMQQASRASDYTLLMIDGEIVESDDTSVLFTNPVNQRTENYVSGRLG